MGDQRKNTCYIRKARLWMRVILILSLCGCAPQNIPSAGQQSGPEIMTIEPEIIHESKTIPQSGSTSGTETTPQSGIISESETISPSGLVPEPETVPESVTLVMVGDILLHTPVEESALREDGSYDFKAVFANLREEIQAADIAIVNQEVILGGRELGISGYPAFNAPYEAGDALSDAGFDIVCHATNHALDKGRRGIVNCLNFWQENHPDMAVLGIYDSEEAQNAVYVCEENGIRIAVLNYTYGTNGIALPEDMPYAVNLLDREQVERDLRNAEEMADFTIVCPHWGTEYALDVSAEQEKWTQIFLEGGADLVLGTHPHVIEPVEWVRDEEQDLEMLVYYSLGNFVNWTSGTGEGVANRMLGAMAQVRLERGEDGKVRIADHEALPVVCHVEEGTDGVTVYALSDYTEELASRNAIVLQDPTFSLEYCRELCHVLQ